MRLSLRAAALAFAVAGIATLSAPERSLGAAPPSRTIDQHFNLRGATELVVRVPDGDLHFSVPAHRQAQKTPATTTAPAGDRIAHVHCTAVGAQADLDAIQLRGSASGSTFTISVDEPRHSHYYTGIGSTYDVTYPPDAALVADTSSGSVVVERPQSSVRARTGSGNIEVGGAASTLDLHTGSGNLDVELADAWNGTGIVMTTGSGNVRLAVPAEFGATLRAHTGSGTVRDDANVSAHGGAKNVTLRTGSGNVTVTPRI